MRLSVRGPAGFSDYVYRQSGNQWDGLTVLSQLQGVSRCICNLPWTSDLY